MARKGGGVKTEKRLQREGEKGGGAHGSVETMEEDVFQTGGSMEGDW